MKKLILILLLSITVFAQQKKVYLADIEGDIDLGLSPYISRVIEEAEKANANAVIFRINTFGGRVDAATQIKDAILESRLLTIAFIKYRAISAGALISLSNKHIVMAKGSTIGASTGVDGTGEKLSEKVQSYLRGEFRSTAERNGRRTDIAEGMVDERIVIPGLVDSTQLVSLTTAEALQYGIADTTASDISEVLKIYDLEGAEVVTLDTNWAEAVIRFLNNPIISSLLIMIGMVGLFTEIKTPGWGLAGTAGVLALALFFGSSILLDLASWLEIIMFVSGIILIVVEIFVIPGFGLPGILGIVLMMAALFLSFFGSVTPIEGSILNTALISIGSALLASIVTLYILYKYLPKTRAFNMFVLNEQFTKPDGFISNPDRSDLIGKKGKTITPLRPAGNITIDGERLDVVTDGDFIERDVLVEVIKTEGARIVVHKAPEE